MNGANAEQRLEQDTRSPIAPIEARRMMMEDPTLGAGSFLDVSLALNPNRHTPYVYRHHTDHRGEVILTGYSLCDLDTERRKYASWYAANGVRQGQPIGVCVGEGIEPLLHFLALSSLGAIPAMINDAMPAPSARRYLDHVGAVGVVCDDPTALAAAYRGAERRPLFIAPSSELHAHEADSSTLPLDYPHRPEPDDVVALIHSSGTTGVPKATMLSHRQFWRGKETRMVRFPATPNDRLLSLMPHSHAGGLSYFMTATLLGLPMVAMADWRRSVVEPVMLAFQPTMIASFPRTFVELATGDLPVAAAANVHTWFNTGDSAHYGHIRRLVQLGHRPAGLIKPWLLPEDDEVQCDAPGSRFLDGLGSSEMGMALFGQAYTPESPRNDRCIGKPLAIVSHAAIVDENGNEVPDGTPGLLAVKSESRTRGYWNSPEITQRFEKNGFWLTGDVAYRDGEGRFYHLDRTVDVIETSTGAIYSLPMEEVLLADCSEVILDGVVIGVPAQDGQQPVAIVRLQPGVSAPSTEALLDLANSALISRNLRPLSSIHIAETDDDYPTGVTGKVLKRLLRTRHAAILN